MRAISRYLSDRLQGHQQLYADLGLAEYAPINDNVLVLVDYLYLLLDGLLQDGHTCFSLSCDAWADELLVPMVLAVQDELSGLDMAGLFCDIRQYLGDDIALMQYLDDVSHITRALFDHDLAYKRHNSATADVIYDEILARVRLILRVYGICHRLSYADFIALLQSHPFISSIDSPDALAYQAPIVILVRDGCHLWLYRSHQAERTLLARIHMLSCAPITPLPISMHTSAPDKQLNAEQKQALSQVATAPFSIITGGPGTGKTFTVAQIVQALYAIPSDAPPHLALAAPTGKAAQRMSESLHGAIQGGDIQLPEPMTVHRLLGIGTTGLPRHHSANPLPYDMIIIDEASMLGVELASQLLSAVVVGARLILLGDAHQLAAVEAGAVLADLCRLDGLQTMRTQLVQSQRFASGSAVGALAQLIYEHEHKTMADIYGLIQAHDDLAFYDIADHSPMALYERLILPYIGDDGYMHQAHSYKDRFYAMNEMDKIKTIKTLIGIFNRYRILTASHIGICGDTAINQYIQNQHIDRYQLPHITHQDKTQRWYHGRVVMVLKNRYDLGLFNGDIGICLQSDKNPKKLSVYFEHDSLKAYDIALFDGDMVLSAYAMTTHKSQGSEFDNVAIVFDERAMRLLSKELIYTAITRAKSSVAIYSHETALLTAINTPTIRNTGLAILAK